MARLILKTHINTKNEKAKKKKIFVGFWYRLATQILLIVC